MTRRPSLKMLGVCLAAACGPGAEDTERWTVDVDTVSNGRLHVTNSPPASGPKVTLVAREVLRIGAQNSRGPGSFGLIRQIAPLPDGRVAVLDRMAQEVRVFGADGRHERTFGGPGAGPGELRDAQGMLLDSDGLLRVPDAGNARMSYFDPDSGFVASHNFSLSMRSYSGPWMAARDSLGRTAVWSAGPYRGGAWAMIRIYDENMAQIDSIPYKDRARELQRRQQKGACLGTAPNGMRGRIPVPFYPFERFVIDPTGQMWTTESGAPLLNVARWEPAGDTILVIESGRLPDPVTNAEKDSVIAALEARYAAWPDPPRCAEIPDSEPPAYGLSLDDHGRLWVRLSNPDADTTAYDVFHRNGRHAETVVIPSRVDEGIPPMVNGHTLWAVVRDETDVQYVIRSKLEAPGPSRSP